MKSDFIVQLHEVDKSQISLVGGKNAALGELMNHLTLKGVRVPAGFAITANAYRYFLETNQLQSRLASVLEKLGGDIANLKEVSQRARQLILNTPLPQQLTNQISEQFRQFTSQHPDVQVAVRSSATAEDLPEDSFAGMHESFLNIKTEEELLEACHECYASLFTARAIKYRQQKGYQHLEVALSIGVQQMVRSDLACSGVCFTIDPESGHDGFVLINASWGLGENMVKGNVTPDEYYVFKKSLLEGKQAVVMKQRGLKEKTMVYADQPVLKGQNTINLDTPEDKQRRLALSDEEVEELASRCLLIEAHYGRPMDVEWAKDGLDSQPYIVQARPETVHSNLAQQALFTEYELLEESRVITEGAGVGAKITSGKAVVLHSPDQIDLVEEGDILVTESTNPDWDPVLRKASAIVTDRGGVTSHAAIVAREVGAVAVVGTKDATKRIAEGTLVTVACHGNAGKVYEGALRWREKELDLNAIEKPSSTQVMLIMADPGQALSRSRLPVDGVGLLRLEFAISNTIQIHPMALVHFDTISDAQVKSKIEHLTAGYEDKQTYFVDKLAQSVAMIAAAFYPRQVVVRMSDLKTNEYANLVGGQPFEPTESNAMLGWRGASRYYSPDYEAGFRLECLAMKKVIDDMGLDNVTLMIPFCRTADEGKRVLRLMDRYGLQRSRNGLRVYVMTEVPSNVLAADSFARVFDGFSIGSNDLTQLVMGVDRDSELLGELFDVTNEAVKKAIQIAIQSARSNDIPIGFCGQAPSDHPAFASFLVAKGITSISFNADALFKGIQAICQAEQNAALS